MKTYTIYHIPGTKIGCTSDLVRRLRDQGFTDCEILEEHTDIYLASTRELELQAEFGLPIDKIPYWQAVQNRPVWNNNAPSIVLNRPKAGKIGGTTTANRKDYMNKKSKTCIHCGKSYNLGNYGKYGGDKCKLKA